MLSTRRRFLTPMLAATMLALVAIGLSACGGGNSSEVEEGEVVKVNHLKYQVIFSRYLNPNDNEDVAYLKGLEPAQKASNYFGVFLLVQNNTHGTLGLVKSLTITDSEDNEYEALPSESEYAFPFGANLVENEQVPELDTTAASGPIQGSVAIFELPEEVSANRPLILHIKGPVNEEGRVKLDL